MIEPSNDGVAIVRGDHHVYASHQRFVIMFVYDGLGEFHSALGTVHFEGAERKRQAFREEKGAVESSIT